ncbi:XrtA system polysaccharide deacetylase [Motiliproteus sediminis]|uniref:XrtA system polysaccharide deacetylase n=1 Tax=Motiliproteus sediminis TaxID=1468178 RepID=UPI001AEF93F6|nr:XrtA system polysaccharide deacetylase [Motiliproteus sediminis]
MKSSPYALSIDVEDYFQVAAFERQCPADSWHRHEVRVEHNVNRLLALLSERDINATFFVLGWVAERYPELIKLIASEGHEVASHGFGHQRINALERQQYHQDVSQSRKLLQDLSGAAVEGYRAPSFSLSQHTPWAQDALREAGYRYSSSINPVNHDLYGYPDAPRTPFVWDNGLLEVPVTTCSIAGKRIPCAGGGYFRLFPYRLFRHLMQKGATELNSPAIFYLHPWELDPGQPRIIGASAKSRFRHYLNLAKTEARLQRLLHDFNWAPMNALPVIQNHLADPKANPGIPRFAARQDTAHVQRQSDTVV